MGRWATVISCTAFGSIVLFNACATPPEKPISAQPTSEMAMACARAVCRTEAKTVRLLTPEGRIQEVTTERVPFVDRGVVTLFPGEAVLVDFAADGSTVTVPRFVRIIDHVDLASVQGFQVGVRRPTPNPQTRETFSFELKQVTGATYMEMSARSDLSFSIAFDAEFFIPTSDGVTSRKADLCPVIAGIGWGDRAYHPISKIVLSNFRVVPDSAMGPGCPGIETVEIFNF